MEENTTIRTTEGIDLTKRAINLDNLKVVVDKFREDHPTRTEVTAQIQQAALGGEITFATTQEILALFQESGGEDQGSGGEDPGNTGEEENGANT